MQLLGSSLILRDMEKKVELSWEMIDELFESTNKQTKIYTPSILHIFSFFFVLPLITIVFTLLGILLPEK